MEPEQPTKSTGSKDKTSPEESGIDDILNQLRQFEPMSIEQVMASKRKRKPSPERDEVDRAVERNPTIERQPEKKKRSRSRSDSLETPRRQTRQSNKQDKGKTSAQPIPVIEQPHPTIIEEPEVSVAGPSTTVESIVTKDKAGLTDFAKPREPEQRAPPPSAPACAEGISSRYSISEGVMAYLNGESNLPPAEFTAETKLWYSDCWENLENPHPMLTIQHFIKFLPDNISNKVACTMMTKASNHLKMAQVRSALQECSDVMEVEIPVFADIRDDAPIVDAIKVYTKELISVQNRLAETTKELRESILVMQRDIDRQGAYGRGMITDTVSSVRASTFTFLDELATIGRGLQGETTPMQKNDLGSVKKPITTSTFNPPQVAPQTSTRKPATRVTKKTQ